MQTRHTITPDKYKLMDKPLRQHRKKHPLLKKHNKQTNQSGFSLIEMMIVLVLIGVITALAAPSFQESINNNRLVTKSNDMVVAISIGRQMAVSRGQTVFLCHSLDADTNTPSCGGAGSDWETGVLVYSVPFGTRVNTPRDYNSSIDTLIRQIDLDGERFAITITATNATDHFGFTNNGLLMGTTGVLSLAVCDNRTNENVGKTIRVTTAGRVSTQTGVLCT